MASIELLPFRCTPYRCHEYQYWKIYRPEYSFDPHCKEVVPRGIVSQASNQGMWHNKKRSCEDWSWPASSVSRWNTTTERNPWGVIWWHLLWSQQVNRWSIVVGRHGAEPLRHLTAHVPRLRLRFACRSSGQVLPGLFTLRVRAQQVHENKKERPALAEPVRWK